MEIEDEAGFPYLPEYIQHCSYVYIYNYNYNYIFKSSVYM